MPDNPGTPQKEFCYSLSTPVVRVRLSHHVMTLDDGHRVGVTVGGQGVPLVFLHGIALSGRAYVRLLSRLAGMGFLVVALDAAGHGVTPNLPRNAADLSHRVATLRAWMRWACARPCSWATPWAAG